MKLANPTACPDRLGGTSKQSTVQITTEHTPRSRQLFHIQLSRHKSKSAPYVVPYSQWICNNVKSLDVGNVTHLVASFSFPSSSALVSRDRKFRCTSSMTPHCGGVRCGLLRLSCEETEYIDYRVRSCPV